MGNIDAKKRFIGLCMSRLCFLHCYRSIDHSNPIKLEELMPNRFTKNS